MGTLLSAKHAALYNNRMFEIAVDKQIYGRFCPDAVPITRSEIGDHIAKLLPQGWNDVAQKDANKVLALSNVGDIPDGDAFK